MIQIEDKRRQEIREKFTKYEIARILGARALQISMNAPVLVKLKKDELEELDYNPFKIAEIEFFQGILPISVKRPFPHKSREKIALEKIEKTVEKKAEDKKVKDEKLQEKKPADKEKLEEEILKEVEDTEVMEMATPADEEEETQNSVEE